MPMSQRLKLGCAAFLKGTFDRCCPGRGAAFNRMARLAACLSLIAVLGACDYSKYAGENCYSGHGGVDIDTAATAPEGLTVAQCEARCNSDSACECVIYQLNKEKCFKRKSCDVPKCTSVQAYDCYIKPGAPTPPPTPPTPPPPTPPTMPPTPQWPVTINLPGMGSLRGIRTANYSMWLGVRYAEPHPPRWSHAQPKQPWNDTLNATDYGNACPSSTQSDRPAVCYCVEYPCFPDA
jgi:hypothetical protein